MARGARAVWLLTGVLLGTLALAPHGARGGERGPALIFAGDVMLDRVTKDSVFRRSLEIGRDRAYAGLFADARAVVGAADVAFANLETPISSRLEPPPGPGEPPRFNAPIELLESLGHAGFDVLSIANNHAYDQGMEGLDRTLSAARRVGLPVVGAGPDAGRAPGPVVIDTAGGRIAFAAWTQGVNRRFGSRRRWVPRVALAHDDSFEATLATAREAAPLVVASLHWARRKSDGLGDEERALLRRVAEAGADVIVGHGLHVPGPIERLRTRDGRTVVAIHTLGNWLGAMRVSQGALQTPELGVRDAPLVSVRTRASGDGRLEPAEVSVIPFWIASPRRPLPWWPGRQRAGARPLSIRGELERIARADCGRRCARRAQAYRKRMELQRVAMGLGVVSGPGAGSGSGSGTGTGSGSESGAGSVSTTEPGSGTGSRTHTTTRSEARVHMASESGAVPGLGALRRGAIFPSAPGPGWARGLQQHLERDPLLRVQLSGYVPDVAGSERKRAGRKRAGAARAALTAAGLPARKIQIRAGSSSGLRRGQPHVVVRLYSVRGAR